MRAFSAVDVHQKLCKNAVAYRPRSYLSFSLHLTYCRVANRQSRHTCTEAASRKRWDRKEDVVPTASAVRDIIKHKVAQGIAEEK